MRQLMVRQKKVLDVAWIEYQPASVEELKQEDWDRLQEINDTEILYQEVNRYLWDKRFAT